LIDELERRKSPELIRILTAIITLEETGKTKFSSNSFFLIAQNFRNAAVSNDLRIRFYRVALNKAKSAIQFSAEDSDSTFDLLNSIANDILSNAPHLAGESSALQTILSSRISRLRNESLEREKRIDESPNELNALISEAEQTENKFEKNYFYGRAAQLALKLEKFIVAVDLAEKTLEGEMPKGIPDTFREGWHDQFLKEVISKALKKDAVDSVKYATKKMVDKLSMSEALRQTAVYYSEKQDKTAAIDAFDEALKITINTELKGLKIHTLFNLIKAAQKVDNTLISEAATATAKAINTYPSLAVEDKPGTENYAKYVDFVMGTNWNLLPVIGELAKENKNEAVYFIDLINKKEVKIIGDFAVSVELLNFEKTLNKFEVKPQQPK
jgi:tetratricopeptide (TPR) repeat protein